MQLNQLTNQTGFPTGTTNTNPQTSFGNLGGSSNQGPTSFGQKPLGTVNAQGQSSSNTFFTKTSTNVNPPTTSTTGSSFISSLSTSQIPQNNPLSSNLSFSTVQPSTVTQPSYGHSIPTGSTTNYDPKQIGESILGIPIYSGGMHHGGIYGMGQPNPKRDSEINNILEVFQSLLSAYDCKHPLNAFKKMLFNRIPKGQEGQVAAYQSYLQVKMTENGKEVAVDYSLWQMATRNNPDPQVLFPCQISSPLEMNQRANTSRVFLLSGIETILNLKNTLTSINKNYENEMESVLAINKMKSKIIREKLLRLFTKLENVANKVNLATKDWELQSQLENLINLIKNCLEENPNYLPNHKEVISNISKINFVSDYLPECQGNKDEDTLRREKNLSIIAEHNRIFNVTVQDLEASKTYLKFYEEEFAMVKTRHQRMYQL